MTRPRSTGLVILLLGCATMVGNTTDLLPPAAFWIGLATYPIGAYLFFSASRAAIDRADAERARRLNPRISNERGLAFAEQQSQRVVNPHAAPRTLASVRQPAAPSLRETESRTRPERPGAMAASTASASEEELMLYEVDAGADPDRKDQGAGFRITSDVSFPLEIQTEGNVADQLEKLRSLRQAGLLTDEEFSLAKAKILG